MDKRVLANSLDNYELAKVTHDTLEIRWDNWDLTDFMAYLVDTCASEALPYLAEQFNCDGLRGFTVANTEEEQRELIKMSIRLHKYMGTPWAIREACRTVGLPDIVLTEGISSIPPDPATDWARFSLLIQTPDLLTINSGSFSQLYAFVNQYKPERSHLAAFGISLPLIETDRLFRPVLQDIDETPIYIGDWEREMLEIQIIGEAMTYFDVIVDDIEEFMVDDNEECLII